MNATANSAGEFRFPFLKPGPYELTAEGPGLARTTVRLTLLVGQEQSIPVRLKVGSVQETVDVSATAGLLQTENGNEVTSFSQRFVDSTPVNGGDITNIVFSTPGLRLNVGGGNANFNVNGLPFNATLFTVNGADIVEPYNLNNKSGASNNTLGANDVAEASAITNAYSAQYGREAGAQVNYISKSGTDHFHGNLVENYNGSFLNANDYFNKLNGQPRARSVANQYAASIGGPIIRNRLQFFANTEGLRYALPTNSVVSLPSQQLQSYVLGRIPASSLPLYRALFAVYNGTPGANRAVPVTTGTLPTQDNSGNLGCGKQGLTSAQIGGGSCAVAFATSASSINTEYFISGRLDYTISDRQKLYFRISRDAGVQATSTSPVTPLFNQQSIQPWVIPQVNYTFAITPRLVNNFILNGNYYSIRSGNPDYTAASGLLSEIFVFTDGGANGSGASSPFPRAGAVYPTGRRGQQLGIIDDLSYSIGKHTLQGGINDRNNRISDNNVVSGAVLGTYTFGSLVDFTNGAVSSKSPFTQSFPQYTTVHTRLNSLGFYAQDEWKILRNLNLTYGVRFELQGNPSCKENCYSRANTAFLDAGYQAGASVPYNQTLQSGQSKNFKNFEGLITEPRFAFAYSPHGEGGTVLRGGIGLFANTIAGSITASVYGNAPNKFTPTVSSGTVGDVSTNGSAQASAVASNGAFQTGYSQGETLAQLRAAVPAGTTFATPTLYVNPDTFHTIRVLEWSAEVEQPLTPRDLLSLSYSGNHGYDEPLSNTAANAYTNNASLYPNGFAGLPTAIPDARFSTVTQISNAGFNNYNGLTVTERHALTHGLQGQVSYTWSKALQFGTVYNPATFAANAGNKSAGSYGPTNFDTRHNIEADIVYVAPHLHGAWLDRTAGNWTVGGKIYRYSGRPFSVTNSLVPTSLGVSTFGSGTVLADTTANVIGTHCGKGAVTTACLSTNQFASAVSPAHLNGQRDFGNTEPNSFRGPGFFSIAAQLSKRVPVTESTYFELGADAYNLINHTNLAVPGSNVGAAGFGLITATVSSPTSIYGTGQGAIVSGRVLVVFGKFIF